ncbi:MAG: hypothetical protein QM597_01955, partial [Aeromicrobium sp.]
AEPAPRPPAAPPSRPATLRPAPAPVPEAVREALAHPVAPGERPDPDAHADPTDPVLAEKSVADVEALLSRELGAEVIDGLDLP